MHHAYKLLHLKHQQKCLWFGNKSLLLDIHPCVIIYLSKYCHFAAGREEEEGGGQLAFGLEPFLLMFQWQSKLCVFGLVLAVTAFCLMQC